MYDSLSLSLFEAQSECSFGWLCQDGSPAVTVVSYLFANESLWMTALHDSARVKALERHQGCALVVSGQGTSLGETRCTSLRGTAVIHRDKHTRDWFFPAFSKRVLNRSRLGAAGMSKSMNNSQNLVIEFKPESVFPYDAQKMMRMANKLP